MLIRKNITVSSTVFLANSKMFQFLCNKNVGIYKRTNIILYVIPLYTCYAAKHESREKKSEPLCVYLLVHRGI